MAYKNMRDSITTALLNLAPEDGDPGPDAFGGYDDGSWPDAAAIAAKFPGVPVLRFTVNPADNEGDCLDVERGDATPAQAPPWTVRRRLAGHPWPTNYVSLDGYPALRAAYAAAGVPEPWYIVAAYPGPGAVVPALPNVMGHQWVDRGPYDETVLLPTYPLFDQSVPVLTTTEATMNTLDPTSNGTWIVDPADGHVESLWSAPYLGGLNEPVPNRYSWQESGTIAGITPWKDPQGSWGYAIIIRHTKALPSGAWYSTYTFARNGSNLQ